MHTRVYRVLSAVLAGISLGVGPQFANAATCLNGFGGTVQYQFTASPSKFAQLGTRPLAGTVFGALSSCAGLSQWPLIATEIVDSSGITLAFRAMTVDAAGCGAVDEIASLSPVSLSGPLQLHNDRNNFSNTTTLVAATCLTPPATTAVVTSAARRLDAAGND